MTQTEKCVARFRGCMARYWTPEKVLADPKEAAESLRELGDAVVGLLDDCQAQRSVVRLWMLRHAATLTPAASEELARAFNLPSLVHRVPHDSAPPDGPIPG